MSPASSVPVTFTLVENVATPTTFNPPAVILTSSLKIETLPKVDTPAILSWSRFAPPTTSNLLFASTRELKVATPATFRSSNWVSPSTSNVLLISTAFENVETPATTSSSTSNCPSISKPPLASIVVNVAIPATLS